MSQPMPPRPKIIFFISEDWYFWSHRLILAQAARDHGFEVCIATRVSTLREKILEQNLKLIPLRYFERKPRSLFRELAGIAELVGIYRRERPDLVHQVSLKLVLYGTLAVWVARVPRCVNALAGLGYLFSTPGKKGHGQLFRRAIRLIALNVLRLLLSHQDFFVIVQNPTDREFLLTKRITGEHNIVLIRGSGVDLSTFRQTPEPSGIPIVMLASRLIWTKGVGEFVEAARLLHNRYGNVARFVLVGIPDPENPASIPDKILEEWTHQYPYIEWWGHCPNMPDAFAQAHIVCLPSYYAEGVPKVLLEAAASGKPIVTTDMPGCREVVLDGENGFLVPPRNSQQLADALHRLLIDPALREQMGLKSRQLAEAEYSQDSVVRATLDLYVRMLGNPSPI
jgi:glycosyltransferase involved in cell wall biosynthesis